MRPLLVAGVLVFVVGCSQPHGNPADAAGPDALASGDGGPLGDSSVTQVDVDSGLPALPPLTNVVATQREDSVGIDFDPFDGAQDYRVYVLPDPGNIHVGSDGQITVHNAIYRCAGMRQANDLPNMLDSSGHAIPPDVGYMQFPWTARLSATPTLGYVYVTPGAGRIPVYGIGAYASGAELGWRESRVKIYTTDMAQRQMLLSTNHWRDDGVVFYVPATAGASTHTVYGSQTADVVAGQGWTQHVAYYFTDADLATHMTDATAPAPAFQVLTAASTADGTQPLMAVFYRNSQQHTELAVGNERYQRAAHQGDGPLWHLEWSGLTGPTTLVVEALASGCPYPGFVAAQALSAPPHQPFATLAALQAAAPTGEVYMNGQYDTTTPPRAIARSFIQVAPQPHVASDWDWYQGFTQGTDLGTATAVAPMPDCGGAFCGRWQDAVFDINAISIDNPGGVGVFDYGIVQGQFWEAFDDVGQDVTGKVRFTALQMATMPSSPGQYLHATMSVNIVSTDRRYPQLILSDQPAPVQAGLANPVGNTLLIQPIEGPSMRLEVQAIHGLVNGRPWDVNNQAHEHRLVDYDDWNASPSSPAQPPPSEPPFEHAGMDRMTRFDAYVSPQRVYLFVDGQPAGCSLYPSGFSLAGSVSVTFGDVLYHEGAGDELVCAQARPYGFMHAHQCTETTRHFDDLGFRTNAAMPAWDEAAYPCSAY